MSETIQRTFTGFDSIGDSFEPTLFNQAEANRLETYFEKVKPELNKKQLKVLKAISEMKKEPTMHEVADYLEVPLNTISGRFGELVKKEKLIITGKSANNRSKYKLAEINH